MIRLKTLLIENYENDDPTQVGQSARNRRYLYKSYRGDIDGNRILTYSRKRRREYGIFTTPIKEVAAVYAGSRTQSEPRLFYIYAPRMLDLTIDSLENMKWVEKWGKSFDDWKIPETGEETYAWDVLSGGRLFDYEGNWSTERWRDIQMTAETEGYDAVVLPDFDSSYGIFPSFVVFDERNLKLGDSVTYSDNKQPIPLTVRFDRSTDDIRY